MASKEARGVPSRASVDIPCVKAMTRATSASASVSGGSTPEAVSRSTRARSRSAIDLRMSVIAFCTSADAAEQLAVVLASRQPLGVASPVYAMAAAVRWGNGPARDLI
jgi:hypothetical protein